MEKDRERKKILIVEDDKKISMALTVRLKSEGYEVVTAYDGVQGVSFAVKHEPDLILLDISMPAGNGLMVAERLLNLASTANIPVIIMTASKKPELTDKAVSLGVKGYFEKPFDTEQLIEAIERNLGEPVL